jgi:aminomethyltransferase
VKKTPFHKYHLEMGARMVPFAGFEMPLEYKGIKHEHLLVREKAGVFDVSHMGEIRIKGKGAASLVQRITSNDIARLVPGMIQYSCFPNASGGIVDDLLVYCYGPDEYLLVVNASNTDKDFDWIKSNNREGARVENESEYTAQLAVQGPGAVALLQKITPVDLSAVPYYHFVTGEMAGETGLLISNSGYTGAGGFEIYMQNEQASAVWEAVLEAGQEFGLEPAGLACRDTLRLEMGYCLYGNDIDESTSPLEAGLGWITKFSEGNDFINRPALEQQRKAGLTRKLIGFELGERGIPRQHYPILDGTGRNIGEVTSGTMSPMTGKGIGMGYVESSYSPEGTGIFIGVRNKLLKAEVVRPPFFRPADKG